MGRDRGGPAGPAARRAGPHGRCVPTIPRSARSFPVIAQSLKLAASPQIRNMATLGGNVLQRTRCTYFRDPVLPPATSAIPAAAARPSSGVNRKHAVLGTSEHCIATYPGDFAQALVALDATVDIAGPARHADHSVRDAPSPAGRRRRTIETMLASGELITGILRAAAAMDAPFAVPEDPRPRILRICARLCGGRARSA